MAPHESAVCTIEELRVIGLFGALSDDILLYLCDVLSALPLGPGEVVFKEGDTGRELFAVLEGELEVLKRSTAGKDMRVALLGRHDWFGEMSVLDVQPRAATVRAVAASRVLRMRSSDLDALYRRDIKAYALVVLNVARELSRRLRVADGLLANLIADAPSTSSRSVPPTA